MLLTMLKSHASLHVLRNRNISSHTQLNLIHTNLVFAFFLYMLMRLYWYIEAIPL